ncbi:hypothetical protein [Scytonema sp. NUACC26]|uniref:hypothetical protein n=1 Tax=Scytonema sp. NUACC26 TaxID=3140176 RepID=UPI0034DB82B3
MEKTTLVNVVDELLAEQTLTETKLADEIINLAHEEKVEEWIEAIARHLKQLKGQSIRLLDLQKALKIPLIEVWLGLLLGGYTLEQRGEFYKTQDVWITF